jgi:hypothetical protein
MCRKTLRKSQKIEEDPDLRIKRPERNIAFTSDRMCKENEKKRVQRYLLKFKEKVTNKIVTHIYL